MSERLMAMGTRFEVDATLYHSLVTGYPVMQEVLGNKMPFNNFVDLMLLNAYEYMAARIAGIQESNETVVPSNDVRVERKSRGMRTDNKPLTVAPLVTHVSQDVLEDIVAFYGSYDLALWTISELLAQAKQGHVTTLHMSDGPRKFPFVRNR